MGIFDINCIVMVMVLSLDFTSRFGFPQIFIPRAGITSPFGEVLYKGCSGIRIFKNYQVTERFSSGAFL